MLESESNIVRILSAVLEDNVSPDVRPCSSDVETVSLGELFSTLEVHLGDAAQSEVLPVDRVVGGGLESEIVSISGNSELRIGDRVDRLSIVVEYGTDGDSAILVDVGVAAWDTNSEVWVKPVLSSGQLEWVVREGGAEVLWFEFQFSAQRMSIAAPLFRNWENKGSFGRSRSAFSSWSGLEGQLEAGTLSGWLAHSQLFY